VTTVVIRNDVCSTFTAMSSRTLLSVHVCYVGMYVVTAPPFHPNESVPVYTHVLVLCPDNDPQLRSKLSCQIINLHKRVSCV